MYFLVEFPVSLLITNCQNIGFKVWELGLRCFNNAPNWLLKIDSLGECETRKVGVNRAFETFVCNSFIRPNPIRKQPQIPLEI